MGPFLRFKAWQSNSIVAFAVAWLAGLWLGHFGWQTSFVSIIAATLCIAVAWRSKWLVGAVAVLGLAAGILYGYNSHSHYRIINNLMGHKANFTGTISDDPATSDKGTTTFTLDSLAIGNVAVPGALTIKTYSSKYQRGYRVQAVGKLYTVMGSKQAGMYGTIAILSQKQTLLERWRQRFITGINSDLPEPLNGFALGLLIGARSLIPKSLQAKLAAVGLSHLVAVSGYNLTIIVVALRRLLKEFSRYVALVGALWLIGVFVVVAGAGSSIVRAAIVSVLSLVAYYYGRHIKPWVLVAVPAVLTTIWRPEYLWSDVGWQLSFLAFIGILVLAPLISARLKRPNWLKKLIIEAVCAQILTFPIILTVFQQFSVVGILANVIVLPLVPLAMLASLIAGTAGAIMPALGVLSLPAYLVLKLMLAIINQLAGLPWASVTLEAPLSLVILLYGSLGLAALALSYRGRSPSTSDGIMPDKNI